MIASMVFFPEKILYEKPADYGFVWEDVTFEASDHVKLHGWFLIAKEPKGTILFFHGNAGNISNRLFKMKGWVDRGFSVFLVDYRGYGKSQGTPRNQNDILNDGHAAWDYLRAVKKIEIKKMILYGESMGTFPATVLASKNKVAALILEAPFTSFVDLAGKHYPFVPKALLKDFEFSNVNHIGSVQSPIFILHGTNDEICPYERARELYKKISGEKEFFEISGGRHNDLPQVAGEDFWEKPYEFVMRQPSG